MYIHNVYGLSESNSPVYAVPFRDRTPVNLESGALSVGIPVQNYEVKE
jgi:long-chain acyl-CoA synthetase